MGNQSHLTPKKKTFLKFRTESAAVHAWHRAVQRWNSWQKSPPKKVGGVVSLTHKKNICIYCLYIYWYINISVKTPMSMLVFFFPIWTFFLMWHRCHLYGWCLSDSWSSELKCLHFDHLHPTPVAQTRFSSRQPKITVAPARAKAYEKGTKTSMTRSGMLRMSFSVPFWDLAIHVFLVVP